jgi:hypothetical protein
LEHLSSGEVCRALARSVVTRFKGTQMDNLLNLEHLIGLDTEQVNAGRMRIAISALGFWEA